jgi:hypothetical protein
MLECLVVRRPRDVAPADQPPILLHNPMRHPRRNVPHHKRAGILNRVRRPWQNKFPLRPHHANSRAEGGDVRFADGPNEGGGHGAKMVLVMLRRP